MEIPARWIVWRVRPIKSMKIIEYSTNNPVKVAVGSIFILLFGLIALFRIPVQLVPDVEKPQITVQTRWIGASPQEVEQVCETRQ